MLETIKMYIQSQPCISFEKYYTDYICSIQDLHIDAEISQLITRYTVTPNIISKIINSEVSKT